MRVKYKLHILQKMAYIFWGNIIRLNKLIFNCEYCQLFSMSLATWTLLCIILENWLSVLYFVSIKAPTISFPEIYLLSWRLPLGLSVVHEGRWSCLSAHWTYPPPGERRHQPEPGKTHTHTQTHNRKKHTYIHTATQTRACVRCVSLQSASDVILP